ncbi:DUF4407 domain-containing protein [Bizionia myxarmorum]|uniref:DUF4407 domain-containing protein n=1 Tax=Bizionia myxarmorum TaxID=291186 RepID=A0A5D0QXZ3_9FLAO|nr:DUF4407 domain-containing protein [Bizionia myxarmorum]TYB74050.1 DUF4407 domain-containing protein [Bizionia myxarmorum]
MKFISFIRKILNKPFQSVYRLFLWSSGADLKILKQAPTDNNKFFGIGGTILFTALMATFAGGYAFFTAFKSPYLAVLFGIFWGALIFNLDRYIVSTFGVGDGKKTISRQELIEAAPRLLMAMILGFVIATPLELKLFESEINAEIARQNLITIQEGSSNAIEVAQNQNASDQIEINTLRGITKDHEAELAALKIKRDSAYDKYMCELNGTCGTGKPGEGPVFREAKAAYLLLNEEFTKLNEEYADKRKSDYKRIEELNEKIELNFTKATGQAAKTETAIEGRNGLLARLSALNNLCYEEKAITRIDEEGNRVLVGYETLKTTVWYAKWLITILFIFIEIAPILFKMMTERGTYDDILDRIKHEAKVKQLLLQSNINQEINSSVKVNTAMNELKIEEELKANDDLIKNIAKAQAEVAAVAIELWKQEQMELVKNKGINIVS